MSGCEFDDAIKFKLLKDLVPEKPKTPVKITVVGAGMVGMACNISVLLKVCIYICCCITKIKMSLLKLLIYVYMSFIGYHNLFPVFISCQNM